MMIVVGSVSGAPGASTVALGMAGLWPDRPALLVEADPAGGVLAARFGLREDPGTGSLAAAARHGHRVENAGPFVQHLPLYFPVVPAPGGAERAAGTVAVLAAHPDTALAGLAPMVIVDVGRLYPGSPALNLVRAAAAVVLVAWPGTEYLNHLDTRLPDLPSTGMGVALTGRGGFPAGEVAHRLGVPVWAQLPRDRWGAGVLAGRLTGRAWGRTRLGQAVRALAVTVADAAGQPAVTRAGVPS